MNVSSVNASAAVSQSNAGAAAGVSKGLPTLAASQQEAVKEAASGVKDGDESLGNNLNKIA